MTTETQFLIQDTREWCGNSALWWRRGRSGYTTDLDEAHIFTKYEAEEVHRNRSSDKIVPLRSAEAASERHVTQDALAREMRNSP